MNIIRTLIRKWKITVPAAGVAVLGLAWLAFGYFGIHTAFIDDKVSEAAPEFAVPAADVVSVDMPDETAAVAVTPVETGVDTSTGGVEAATSDTGDSNVADAEAPVATTADGAAEAPTAEPAAAPETVEATSSTPGEVATVASGSFQGTSRYDVSGDAIVLGNGTEQRFLRFENFESNNGPDLNVYLINPDDPSDFIDLGDLKGNIGDQNYEIPADVDLERYSQVSIWCVRFSVGFGFADLATA